MKNVEDCKLLINELVDINVRQCEIIRKISRNVEAVGDEQIMDALKNYFAKVSEEADAVRALYVAVENLFADGLLKQINQK